MEYCKYIGVPFQDNGRDSEGYDCWGLVKKLYLEMHGEVLPDFSYDDAMGDGVPSFFMEELYTKSVWEEVPPQEGSIAVFSIGGVVRHVGFMINSHEFIHTISGCATVIESVKGLRWSARFKGSYKWQQL